ncbi:MAG: LLM class flavin-dependent oxidoreductase [Solirubrobacteraceae bacterium]|nr:LLM class flavin-dependent oxidoreductase [Solirubrobacteraceae bacterium]
MRIGCVIDTHDRLALRRRTSPRDVADDLDAVIEEAHAVERAGFHGIMVPDRHGIAECLFPGPEQLLTVLARETRRVAIGTFTSIVTLTHPLKVAEQLAVVDQLSRGRLFATVSRGFMPSFWRQFGVPEERLLGRFKEAVSVWQAAFEGERFDFDGDHWAVRDGLLAPPPYQDGGWPIWGGGNAALAAIRRAGEFASAWTCDPGPLDPATWDVHAGAYRERAREHGREPFVVLMRDAWVADTVEDAFSAVGPRLVKEARYYLERGTYSHHPGFTRPDDATVERLAEHVVVGDAERCRERLRWYGEELGVDYVVVRLRFPGGPDHGEVLEQVARFGEEVVTPVHRAAAAPEHPAIPTGARW